MKSQTKNPEHFWFGYDVVSASGNFPRPQRIEFWKDRDFNNLAPEVPLHYKADALLGLSLYLLHHGWNSKHLPPHGGKPDSLTQDLWKSLEPHYELFLRAQPRVSALRRDKSLSSPFAPAFEKSFTEILDDAAQKDGWNLEALQPIMDLVDDLEIKLERPLLYDFSFQVSPEMRTKLHWLHSCLFHLRTLIAIDYNAYIHDATHEAVKVDSITDYVARAEYVANDALLYWNFKKMRERLPADAATDLEQHFLTYSHNGAYLIESLPKSFLSAMNAEELEESLYLVQMDWLLGTDAGLLFRIREELYGLHEGYENIFWRDVIDQAPKATSEGLSIQCELTESVLGIKPAA